MKYLKPVVKTALVEKVYACGGGTCNGKDRMPLWMDDKQDATKVIVKKAA